MTRCIDTESFPGLRASFLSKMSCFDKLRLSIRIARKQTFSRRCQLLYSGLLLLVLCCCSVWLLPVHNVVLGSYTHHAWRNIPTYDLLRIHLFSEVPAPDGILNIVSCGKILSAAIPAKDVNTSNILNYPSLQRDEVLDKVLTSRHGRYLPAINVTQKVEYLYLYTVLANSLETVRVQHFLVSGSLLGVYRHRGLIPWDDDIDIAVPLDSWELVRQTLSCIEGFELSRYESQNFHWKFHFWGRKEPFVDIFYYQLDEHYVWALPWYIRHNFIYSKHLVFPLTWATFEGVKVPVPRDGLRVVQQSYEYDRCVAHAGHIDRRNDTLVLMHRHPEAFSVESVPCAYLSYMYTMHHLEGSG